MRVILKHKGDIFFVASQSVSHRMESNSIIIMWTFLHHLECVCLLGLQIQMQLFSAAGYWLRVIIEVHLSYTHKQPALASYCAVSTPLSWLEKGQILFHFTLKLICELLRLEWFPPGESHMGAVCLSTDENRWWREGQKNRGGERESGKGGVGGRGRESGRDGEERTEG